MSTRAVYQPRELYINSNQKLKRKHFWSTQPCRPGRCINRDQQIKSICGTPVYHQRGVAVYHQQSKTKAKALLDDTDVSTRAVYQPRLAEQSISGAAVYQQRGVAVFQQQSKWKAKAHVDQGGINRDQQINSNQKLKRKPFWMTQPCRPGQYINRESCISTAIKTEAKALLVDTAVSTWAVYQPRSAKQNHPWLSCISPARHSYISPAPYSCISTAKKN